MNLGLCAILPVRFNHHFEKAGILLASNDSVTIVWLGETACSS
jgi:hypothetical protein